MKHLKHLLFLFIFLLGTVGASAQTYDVGFSDGTANHEDQAYLATSPAGVWYVGHYDAAAEVKVTAGGLSINNPNGHVVNGMMRLATPLTPAELKSMGAPTLDFIQGGTVPVTMTFYTDLVAVNPASRWSYISNRFGLGDNWTTSRLPENVSTYNRVDHYPSSNSWDDAVDQLAVADFADNKITIIGFSIGTSGSGPKPLANAVVKSFAIGSGSSALTFGFVPASSSFPMKGVADQTTCFEVNFAPLSFEVNSDQLVGTEMIDYTVTFVSGTDVVNFTAGNTASDAASVSASWTPVVKSGVSGTGVYRVTPKLDGVEGTSTNFSLTVHSDPANVTVNEVGHTLPVNNGDYVPATHFTGLFAGANIKWELNSGSSAVTPADLSAMGFVVAPQGYDAIPAFAAVNTGSSVHTLTFDLTAEYTDGSGCASSAVIGVYTIKVAPKVIEDPSLSIRPLEVPGLTSCWVQPHTFNVQFRVQRNNVAFGPGESNVDVKIEFVEGVQIVNLNGANPGQPNYHVIKANTLWNMSVVNASIRVAGTGTYRATPIHNGVEGKSTIFTLTMLPELAPNKLPQAGGFVNVNHGQEVPATVLNSLHKDVQVTWRVSGVNVAKAAAQGLPTSGKGQIPAFTAVNTDGTDINIQFILGAEHIDNLGVACTPAPGGLANSAYTINILSAVTPLAVDVAKTDPTCATATDGKVTVTVNGGSGDYDVTLRGITQTISGVGDSTIFTGQPAGTHNIVVTDNVRIELEPVHLTVTLEAKVFDPISAIVVVAPVACGDIAANHAYLTGIVGGSGSYEFFWSDGHYNLGTPSSLPHPGYRGNVPLGDYTVIIRDRNCAAVEPFSLSFTVAPEIPDPIVVESIDVFGVTNCTNGPNGRVGLIVSGGSDAQNLHYVWSNGAGIAASLAAIPPPTAPTSGQAFNWHGFFAPGDYEVTITDPDCPLVAPVKQQVTIPNGLDPILIETAEIVDETVCGAEDGSIELTMRGVTGATPFHFLWTNSDNGEPLSGLAPTHKIEGLSAGSYTVTISDPTCSYRTPITQTFVVGGPALNPISALPFKQNPSCSNDNGVIGILDLKGGSGNYSYALSDGHTFGTAVVGDNISLGNTLPAGSYTITIRDEDCPAVEPFVLTIVLESDIYEPISASVIKQNPSCNNNDGSAGVLASGGSGNYSYIWSNQRTTASAGNDLSAGSYVVTVRDLDCPAVLPVTLTVVLDKDVNTLEIALIEKVDPTCHNGTDGRIVVAVSGGNGDYTYTWTGVNLSGPFSRTAKNLMGLSAGSYNLKVTASGTSCSAELTGIILNNPASIDVTNYIQLGGSTFTYLNGEQVPTFNLAENLPAGISVSWVATTTPNTIGVANAGGAEVPGFTAKYTAGGENTVNIAYTIVDMINGCTITNATDSFKIVVDQKTVEDLDLFVNPVASQAICSDTTFAAVNLTASHARFAPASFTGAITYKITYASGDNILDLSTDTVMGTLPTATGWSPTISLGATGTGTYRITPYWNNTKGQSELITLTVYPEPKVDAISDIVLCNESALRVNFTGSAGTLFDWTASANTVGIPTTGAGPIDIARLNNISQDTIKTTIRVTPRISGQTCTGVTELFTVTVLPTPRVAAIANVILEQGITTSATDIQVTGTATSYIWTSSNPAISTTLAASGTITTVGVAPSHTGDFPTFTTQNTNTEPVVSEITVTPVFTNSGLTCYGTPMKFSIIVMPRLVIPAISNVTLCEGDRSQPINVGLPTGPNYYITWTGGAAVGLADVTTPSNPTAPGIHRSIPSFTAATAAPGDSTMRTVTVTPHIFYGGAEYSGAPVTFRITVSPNVAIDPAYAETASDVRLDVCEGENTSMSVVITGNTALVTYQWFKNGTPIPGATSDVYDITAVGLADAGKYHCVVTGGCNDSKKSRTYIVTTRVDVLKQSWDNTIVLKTNPADNGGYQFSDIEWFEVIGGVLIPIPGNKSYLVVPGGVNGKTYIARAQTQYGVVYETCPHTGDAGEELSISIYPNPVRSGESFTVNVEASVTIPNMSAQLVDLQGSILRSVTIQHGTNTIQAPRTQGTYILNLLSGNSKVHEYKIIVN